MVSCPPLCPADRARLLRAVHLVAGLVQEPPVASAPSGDAPDLLAQALLILSNDQLLPWHAPAPRSGTLSVRP